ncbi:two-component system sensor histidine kinase NtrB [Thermosulfurimonas dismutans]|uniref:histidine kinase n=1 Tax=Thermosulfurimonas dismutans TaxID=999894 RepID=A0A179D1Y9_9BACT|nr:ATP-binding protein [Thermosulfurimonas dismutans]OAQ20076.1 sensory box histidine kinase/response regulator [Thermosulfurimonas dismutans]
MEKEKREIFREGLTGRDFHAFQEYLQLQRMEAIENLSRGIYHDLRNCLTVLKGGLEILSLKCAKSGNELCPRIKALRKIVEQLGELVERLSALQANGLEGHKEALELKDLSSEVKEILRSIQTGLPPGIRLRFEPSFCPLPVKMGPGECWRVVSNLVSNACEAMNGEGEILISTSLRQVSEEECRLHGNAYPGEFAVLVCQDQGCGIPEEMLDKIFEPMVTTKGENASRNRGWGLAIVYSLVKRRGGWIHVTSKLGEGTRFEIYFPLAK